MEELKKPDLEEEPLTIKGITQSLLSAYTDVLECMNETKGSSNSNRYKLRTFTVPFGTQLGFIDMQTLRSQFGDVIEALYIFRFDGVDVNGYTHAIYVRIKGYCNRRKFESFVVAIVEHFACSGLALHPIEYKSTKTESLQTYMKRLYVHPQNLIINYSDRRDALGEQQLGAMNINHVQAAGLRDKAIKNVSMIMENIMLLPDKYEGLYLHKLLNMTPKEYKNFMRRHSLQDVLLKVAEDAYSLALQDKGLFPEQSAQLLSNPTTKSNMIRTVLTGKQSEQLQKLLHGQFSCPFVHPHPLNDLAKGSNGQYGVFEGMLLDYRFLFPLLFISRWFAKTCMRNENAISSDNAQLVLYGTTGTGKTFITSILSKCIAVYKYMPKSDFQSPELLRSAITLFEEFDTAQLPTNAYKQIFDIKSYVKINFKNMHPEDATENMPCIITTNDEILTALRHITNKKPAFYGQCITATSVEAALRRLYLVPFKGGQFNKLHTRTVPESHPNKHKVAKHLNKFSDEPDKLERFFNLIFALALTHTDISSLQFQPDLARYMQRVVFDYDKTCLSKFLIQSRQRLNELYSEVEYTMTRENVNDNEFYSCFSRAQAEFYNMQVEFLKSTASLNVYEDTSILSDSLVPWPARVYGLIESKEFQQSLRRYEYEFKKYMNRDAQQFLARPENAPYVIVEEESISEDAFDFISLGKRSFSCAFSLQEFE